VHADRLHLCAWFCECGMSRHAHRVARASSPDALLADVHASGAPGTQDLGSEGPVDTRHCHRLALWPLAHSDVLERPSPRELVGTGALGALAGPRNGVLSLFSDGRHADNRGTKNPVAQKGRTS
jgi:hypothetical protein